MADDRTWFLMVRKSDQMLVAMDVNLVIGDHTKAIGQVRLEVGEVGSFSHDFDSRVNVFSYISSDGFFTQKKIEKIGEDPFMLEASQVELTSELRYFIEPSEEDGRTRFRQFARQGDFWVAGNDQGDGKDDKRKISIYGLDQISFVSKNLTSEFGKHAWIMSDENPSGDEGMIVAVSRDWTIEFYHAFYSQVIDAVQVFQLEFAIEVDKETVFDSVKHSNGNFIWQPELDQAPLNVKICPTKSYLDPVTNLCTACPHKHGTTDLLQTECISCHEMWKIGQNVLEPEDSIELALSYIVCDDPTIEPQPPIVEEIIEVEEPIKQLEAAQAPAEEANDFDKLILIVIPSAVVLLATFLIIVLCCCCKRKQAEKKTNQPELKH